MPKRSTTRWHINVGDGVAGPSPGGETFQKIEQATRLPGFRLDQRLRDRLEHLLLAAQEEIEAETNAPLADDVDNRLQDIIAACGLIASVVVPQTAEARGIRSMLRQMIPKSEDGKPVVDLNAVSPIMREIERAAFLARKQKPKTRRGRSVGEHATKRFIARTVPIYEEAAGRRASISKDGRTGHVSGPFVRFVGALLALTPARSRQPMTLGELVLTVLKELRSASMGKIRPLNNDILSPVRTLNGAAVTTTLEQLKVRKAVKYLRLRNLHARPGERRACIDCAPWEECDECDPAVPPPADPKGLFRSPIA